MPIQGRGAALAVGLTLAAATFAGAESPLTPHADALRPVWTVEATRAGRAQVVGYLYNGDIRDAANVWLRVDRLGADGAVADSRRWRVMGDVLSGGRSVFEVPVPMVAASYRVTVETVDWVKECR